VDIVALVIVVSSIIIIIITTIIKFVVICNVILCSSEDMPQHFGGTLSLHLQGKTAKMRAAGN